MSRGYKRAAVAALCLILLAAIPTALWKTLSAAFQDQTAAERWQGSSETEYVQLSCLIDEFQNFSYDNERQRCQELEVSMSGDTSASFATAGSGMTSVTVEAVGKRVAARAICTYGNFALFHPMKMLSGSFYGDGEANHDGVVIDMNLAWKLYGGYDLKGMSVSINGVPMQITGVTDSLDGIAGEAFGVTPTVWIPMEYFPERGSAPAVTCYELVLPNPVDGYGMGQVKTLLNFSADDCDYLENTNRFSPLNSLKNLLKTGARLMRSSKIRYPYWENAARSAENRCAIYIGIAALLLLYPVCFVLTSAILLLIRLRRRARGKIEAKRKYWK